MKIELLSCSTLIILVLSLLTGSPVVADVFSNRGNNNIQINSNSSVTIINGRVLNDEQSNCIKGDGVSLSKKRPITSSLSKLRVKGNIDVHVKHGKRGMLKIKTDSNLVDYIALSEKAGVLELNIRGCISTTLPIKVSIVLPRLTFFESRGSGDSSINGINETRFKLRTRGSGDISLSGVVVNLDANARGSGDISMTSLFVTKANIFMRGSGDIHAFVKGDLAARLFGSGDLYLSGKPNSVNKKFKGSGRIIGDDRI